MDHQIMKIDCRPIGGWGTFHDLLTSLFGLPPTYGRNMLGWMNAMEALDDPDSPLSSFKIPPGSILTLYLENVYELARNYQPIYETLLESVAITNWRRIEAGKPPVLTLAFFKN